jgi:hypothetical protein
MRMVSHLDLKRWACLLLLALALLPRMMIPVGYMPHASASGITITMCGGMAPVTLALPNNSKKSAPDHDRASRPCIFAAATTQAAVDGFVAMVTAPIVPSPRFDLPRTLAHFVTPRLAAPPPPSQAPPATA